MKIVVEQGQFKTKVHPSDKRRLLYLVDMGDKKEWVNRQNVLSLISSCQISNAEIKGSNIVQVEEILKMCEEKKLEYIGLSDKEACDFITYWLPKMNEYDYCLVSFQMDNYEEQVKIDFSIKPDNELRLFAAFKGLENPISIEPQDLSYYKDFNREGFVVVEWGGTFVK